MSEKRWKEKEQKWYREAKEDLEKAIRDLNNKDYKYSCFFAQQAVEKLLKSIYFSKGEIRKGHDLVKLLKGLRKYNIEIKDLVKNARALSIEYVITRYPNSREMFPEIEYTETYAQETLRRANRLWQSLEKNLVLE